MAATHADDLGQRIVGSAKGLAYATISGLAGIDSDIRLHDSFGTGKRIAEPAQSSRQKGVVPTDFSRNLSSLNFTSQPFRSTAGWVNDVEREYQDFASGPSSTLLRTGSDVDAWIEPLEAGEVRTGWEMLWVHKRVADLPSGRQSIISTPSPQLDDTTPIWERSSRGEVVFQEDGSPEWKWRHEWKRINKHLSREAAQQASEATDETAFELDLATRMDGTELEQYAPQSTALARLNLLKAHLISTKPAQKSLQSWKQDWEMHQHERCDWTVEREDDKLPPREEGWGQEPDRYYFHCPWRDCHHRLLRQNENLSLDIRQRVCVHEGCGYVSDTVESWLKHVTKPHHDLQHARTGQDDDQSSCGCASSESEHIH